MHRRVVEDGLAAQQPVVAVAGVGVERDIGDDADVRHGRLDRAHRAADQIVRVQRLRSGLVAQGAVGVGEQRDGGDVLSGSPDAVDHPAERV